MKKLLIITILVIIQTLQIRSASLQPAKQLMLKYKDVGLRHSSILSTIGDSIITEEGINSLEDTGNHAEFNILMVRRIQSKIETANTIVYNWKEEVELKENVQIRENIDQWISLFDEVYSVGLSVLHNHVGLLPTLLQFEELKSKHFPEFFDKRHAVMDVLDNCLTFLNEYTGIIMQSDNKRNSLLNEKLRASSPIKNPPTSLLSPFRFSKGMTVNSLNAINFVLIFYY